MKSEVDFDVDFVIPWVDGSDENWREKRFLYQGNKVDEGNSDQRFQDQGTLLYLLRSIELYANWVSKIYLVTDNQVPTWLKENERIVVIDHKDYIPEKYLPTFNSNVIELNLWRLQDLSEHFVLLNDDLLFINKTKKSDFFTKSGQPRDIAAQSVFMPRDDFAHIPVNNISLINKQFNKREWIKKNWATALNYKNGIFLNTLSLILSPLPYFTRFFEPHVGTAYLKSNFIKVWELFPDKLDETSLNKFRGLNEVSHWLVRYYQILTGQIKPRSYKFGKYLSITDSDSVQYELKRRKHKMLALNDDSMSNEDSVIKTMNALSKKYSNKGQFEK